MSILLMAHAMDLEGLTPGQKSVLVVMCNYANDDGKNVYPSHETVAKKTSYERRTIVSTVKQLTDLDFVAFVKRRGNRQNEYELNVNKILQMCNDCTGRCANIAHNPLDESLDSNRDKGLKDLKIHDDTEIAHLKAQQYEMMQVLALTCSRVLADNRQILGRFAKKLLQLGYTHADLTRFSLWWYKYDWRGKLKQAPAPAQVVELIGMSKSNLSGMNNNPKGADVDTFRKLWEEQRKHDEIREDDNE